MPMVRALTQDPSEAFRLSLARLGLSGGQIEAAAGVQPFSALITGASEAALEELRADPCGMRLVPGDAGRAPGTLILAGTREGALALAERLRARGSDAAALGLALRAALDGSERQPPPTQIGRRLFEWGSRSYVMGIVNVTPDSFSDGGRYFSKEKALAHGEQLAGEGADILDIGGESTRPGSEPVGAQEEIDRVAPVIEALAARVEAPISIDTTKAAVAEAAVKAGASLVNDVSGFTFDPEMAPTVARLGAAACVMHLQGEPRTMQRSPSYFDVVGEVLEALEASLELGERCGIPRERMLIDPGIGFGKTGGHNLFLLRHVGQLRALGRPILVGASRKRFIGTITGKEVGERMPGSVAVHTAAILQGAHLVRVHDVAETVAAARLADAILSAREGGLAYGG